MRNRLQIVSLGLALIGSTLVQQVTADSPATTRLAKPTATAPAPSLDLLADYLTGHFSSKKQSQTHPTYFEIHLHAARIWTDRKDGPWLYVEQARGDSLDDPYRQRVYHLALTPDGVYTSDVYELPGTPDEIVQRYTGAWKDPAKLAVLTPQQLKKKDGCTVYLNYAEGLFDGATQGKGCGSARPDVKYISSEVHAAPEGLRTWDRGFDESGKQTMGAVDGPYVFDRITE